MSSSDHPYPMTAEDLRLQEPDERPRPKSSSPLLAPGWTRPLSAREVEVIGLTSRGYTYAAPRNTNRKGTRKP